MKTKLIILLTVIITITACRKYPEGGSYLFKKTASLVSGDYKIIHYYVNGIDSVDYYFRENINNNNMRVSILFRASKYGHPDFIFMEFGNKKYSFSIHGDWELENKDKKLIMNMRDIDIQHPQGFDTTIAHCPFISATTNWEILKLKDGDMFLETDYNGKHYRVEMN